MPCSLYGFSPISSKNRIAIIKELNKETELQEIIEMASDKDIILVEGYKKSNLRKIEVYRDGISEKIITPKEKLIAIASDIDIHMDDVKVIPKEDFKALADLIEKEEEVKI